MTRSMFAIRPLWYLPLLLPAVLVMALGSPAVRAAPVAFDWLAESPQVQGLADVRRLPESAWRHHGRDAVFNQGLNGNGYWLRVTVPPQPMNRVLEIRYPLLDQVSVFWVVGGEVVEQHRTGDARPFASRPIPHRYFVFLVPSNTQAATAYIRVQTEGALQVPVAVTPSAIFLANEQVSFGWQAMFFGIMVAMTLYNLFLYVIVRRAAYLWYVLTVVASAAVHLNFNGLLFQWLWPSTPVVNQYFTGPIVALNVVVALGFTLNFLAVRRYSPWCYRLLQAFIAASVVTFIVGILGNYHTSVVMISVVAAMVTPSAWLVSLYIWRRGQILAGFYALAWTPLLLGHLVQALGKVGLTPTTTLTELAPQLGVAIEVILLSFALAYRINLERRGRQAAQDHALRIQQQANQTLELRVQQRTEALEQANEQLKAISVTDGLTGVANRRRFDEKLSVEWNRALRQAHPLSLLLLDIDYFKRVNDELGHLVGDDCLIEVASLCHAEIQRSGDLLARYGGEEFGILLPATPDEGAVQVAERLRQAIARSSVHTAGGVAPVNLTVSVGVATMVPSSGMLPQDLIRRADEALYAAKAGGRNRVMVLRGSTAVAATGS